MSAERVAFVRTLAAAVDAMRPPLDPAEVRELDVIAFGYARRQERAQRPGTTTGGTRAHRTHWRKP